MHTYGMKTARLLLVITLIAIPVSYIFVNVSFYKVLLAGILFYGLYLLFVFQTVRFDAGRVVFAFSNPFRKGVSMDLDEVERIYIDMWPGKDKNGNITIYTRYGTIKMPAILCNSELRELARSFKDYGIAVDMKAVFVDDVDVLA